MGFTDGEIKVYQALIKLQKSTISKIIEVSGVSSSKVYSILDKLAQKGLVNYILINNVKEFHLANPNTLLDFVHQEQKELDSLEKETKNLVTDLQKIMPKQVQESAHIYRGLAGLKAAHINLTNELNPGEEYVFFSVDKEALIRKEVQLMFKSIHARRDERGVVARGIAAPHLRKIFEKNLPSRKEYQIRFHDLTLNQGMTIGKNRIILETAHSDAFAIEIISPQMAKSYKEFFNKLWKIAKP